MKYALLIGDGMSDRPLPELDGKTPLEVAKIPFMNELVERGTFGIASTIPRGMPSGSDVANLSLLGYDPKKFYTGRGPLEAANIGVKLEANEIAFRCNLITANNDILSDYSAGHITNKESAILMNFINEKLGGDTVRFYHGTSYRNLAVMRTKDPEELEELVKVACVPPHDILNQSITKFMPKGTGAERLIRLMEESRTILERHEINRVRIDLKENPANMIWLWGQGTNPDLPSYKELFGLEGALISAVDLLKGIGRLVGLDVVNVPGATGYYDTNYKGKGEYAVESLKKKDFVFVHVEAPDEAGHNGEMRQKIEAIENFDKFVVGAVWNAFKDADDFRIMVLPDHATPISVRTHTDDPVPFVICGKGIAPSGLSAFSEKNAKTTKVKFKSGYSLTRYFIKEGL
jgi:2,3-bisphosphoglycerate-independent phosphoglycerate mutase